MNEQTDLEQEASRFLGAVYDHPRAVSIRDGDGMVGTLPPVGCVQRFRLACYAAENLLLTDEVLATLGTDWAGLQARIDVWAVANSEHKDADLVCQLRQSPDRLRHIKIKPIRQLICAICGTSKPWEVVVGQTMGKLAPTAPGAENSLADFIGVDALRELGLRA